MSKPERRAYRAALQRRLRQRPEEKIKAAARSQVKRALRAGKIARGPCEVCGDISSEAHHDDYSKQLDVRWLCRVHHAEHHAEGLSPQRLEAIKAGIRAGKTQRDICREVGIDHRVVRFVREGNYGAVS